MNIVLVEIEGFVPYIFNFVANQEKLSVVEGWECYCAYTLAKK